MIASTIESHFADHFKSAKHIGEKDLAPQPSAFSIEMIIDVAFWASLRREEGRSPKISLAYLPPEKAELPLIFETRLPLTTIVLTKLAPAVERAGIHLGVWHDQGEFYIWGTTRAIPGLCFVLEVVEPGLLVIKHRRIEGLGKFVNVAILKGDQVKVVDETSVSIPDCPVLISSLLGLNSVHSMSDSMNILIQLAVSMRGHGRGGTLLVVPSSSTEWRKSIIHPISYPVVPAYSALSSIMKREHSERDQEPWQNTLGRAVESIAGLTAVDGATVITDQHDVLAFGAKIKRSENSASVEKVIFTEPIAGSTANVLHPAQNGGTRHLSAAQFVFDQRNSLALVASQDGRFTIFGWSRVEQMVHAHRIDYLLV
jgi:hypothetical protein